MIHLQTRFLLISNVVILTFISTRIGAVNNFVFGECSPGKGSCRDCYISLAQHLFQSDDNVFNLSAAFFPPDTNTPEFVVVRYHFQNNSYEKIQTWFWGASASYFLYPMATFQFLSLFFGKPEAFWTSEVDITLNATECEGVKQNHLKFLTQRLRIYIEQYHIRPSIDDTYQAEAVNEATLGALFEEKANLLVNTVIVLQTLGVVLILASVAMIAACTIKGKNNQRLYSVQIKHKPAIYKQAILISASVNGMVFLLYALALDIAAIYYRNNSLLSDLEVINHKDNVGQPFDILYNLPIVVLVFDAVAALPCIIMLFIVIVHFCYKGNDREDYSIMTVKPILLGPILSFAAHCPFIAIAYINDAYYAGSIFVYYVIIFFACFAAVHLTMNACLKSIVLKGEWNIWNWIFQDCCKLGNKEDKDEQNTTNDENSDSGLQMRRKCTQTLCPITISFLMLLFILTAVVIVILYLVIIPLNGSVSGAPHQLFGFYQSIIIFLGILITYKTVLHKKHGTLKHAIKKKESLHKLEDRNWDNLPDEDKGLKFYSMVIDLVEYFHDKKVSQRKKAPELTKHAQSLDRSGTTDTHQLSTKSSASSVSPESKIKEKKEQKVVHVPAKLVTSAKYKKQLGEFVHLLDFTKEEDEESDNEDKV